MNNDLVMRAIVTFKGEWPVSGWRRIKPENRIIGVCLKSYKEDGVYESGELYQIGIGFDYDYWLPICNRKQFETRLQEFADAAPEGATHYTPEDDHVYQSWWKKVGDDFSMICDESCVYTWESGFWVPMDKLIPLPPKTAKTKELPSVGNKDYPSIFIDGCHLPHGYHDSETGIEFEFYKEFEGVCYYKDKKGFILRISDIDDERVHYINDTKAKADDTIKAMTEKVHDEAIKMSLISDTANFAPEVGQECEFYQIQYPSDKRTGVILYLGSDYVVTKHDGEEQAYLLEYTRFNPLKTEAEKERERLYDEIFELDADLDDYQINRVIEFIQGRDND